MSYIPHTKNQTKEMLKTIGVSFVDNLFKDIKPELRAKSFDLPEGKSEFEVIEQMKGLASKNRTDLINFVGAGFYDHYIPSAVDAIVNRS